MNDRDETTDVWAEVVAAVEFLREGARRGLTVWEVLDEAIREWLLAEDRNRGEGPWVDPDPLRTSIEMILRDVGSLGGYGAVSISTVFTSALRGWLENARGAHNDSCAYVPRSSWTTRVGLNR